MATFNKKIKIEMLQKYTYFLGLNFLEKACREYATSSWLFYPNDYKQANDLLTKLIDKNKEVIEEQKEKFVINTSKFIV